MSAALERLATRYKAMGEIYAEVAEKLEVEISSASWQTTTTIETHSGVTRSEIQAALQTPALSSLPAIGAQLERGSYAGVTCDKQGKPYALLLLADKPDGSLTWRAAMDWAKSIDADLPNRVEGALLFANLPGAFERAWHWTNEQSAGYESYAWYQYFTTGTQSSTHKSYEGRVRAVRRLPIDPSILLGVEAA